MGDDSFPRTLYGAQLPISVAVLTPLSLERGCDDMCGGSFVSVITIRHFMSTLEGFTMIRSLVLFAAVCVVPCVGAQADTGASQALAKTEKAVADAHGAVAATDKKANDAVALANGAGAKEAGKAHAHAAKADAQVAKAKGDAAAVTGAGAAIAGAVGK